MRFHVV